MNTRPALHMAPATAKSASADDALGVSSGAHFEVPTSIDAGLARLMAEQTRAEVIARLASGAIDLLHARVAAFSQWRRVRATWRELYALDARMLDDIGLQPGDIRAAAAGLAHSSFAERVQPPRAASPSLTVAAGVESAANDPAEIRAA